MKLVYASNYLSHYSKTISEAFIRIYGDDFKFIAFTPFNRKRLEAGFHDMNDEPYVLRAYESPEAMSYAHRLMDEAEYVIIGGLPVSFITSRLKLGRITFMQSERFYKGPLKKDIARWFKYSLYSGGRTQARDRRSKFYLLCVSAFAAWDYSTCGLFKGKAYRWGYFPEAVKYDDVDGLISRKKQKSLIWVGRFLDWKHPDIALRLAANLRDMGLDFTMKIIGSGEMHDDLSRMRDALRISSFVELTGAIPTEQVRREMESAQIFLFTSGRTEGWGVVLNEAMNSGCAVIAGKNAGATPYLVKDGHNGIIFRDGDISGFTEKVAGLLRNPAAISKLGHNAYETITGIWSPDTAAQRFVRLAEALNETTGPVSFWDDGPCSIAPVM